MNRLGVTIEEVDFLIVYSYEVDKGDLITPPYESIDIQEVYLVGLLENIEISKLLDIIPKLEELLKDEIIVELIKNKDNEDN